MGDYSPKAKKVDNRNSAITLGIGVLLFGAVGILTAPDAPNPYSEPGGFGFVPTTPGLLARTRPDTSIGCAWGDRAVGTCSTP